jgi:hypothetical protein
MKNCPKFHILTFPNLIMLFISKIFVLKLDFILKTKLSNRFSGGSIFFSKSKIGNLKGEVPTYLQGF